MIYIEIIGRTDEHTTVATKKVEDWSEALADLVKIFTSGTYFGDVEEIKLTKMP